MNIKKLFVFFLLVGLFTQLTNAQDCDGAAITTKESYLYGRFEVNMKSAAGSGIVSSFFLYNINTNCNWPAENNEIDIEMTGQIESVIFTTHHPHPVYPWHYGETMDFDFNPHETFQDYAIEWEPGIVRWFVNNELAYVQNDNNTDNLNYPMAILMNLYSADAPDWAGVWNASVMPRQSQYDYVKYYSYTPQQGNTGTNNNFTLEWEDDFNSLDTNRWDVSDFSSFGGNNCTFRMDNVAVNDGLLTLTIDEPTTSDELVPVTFSVNTNDLNLLPSDIVCLNGGFNEWCGNCSPMVENNGIWSLTLDLPLGNHEYLFSVNLWETIGNAPLASSCDFFPCDEWKNYGVLISEAQEAIVLDTYCWQSCNTCALTTNLDSVVEQDKTLVNVYDLFGRTVSPEDIAVEKQLLFYLFDDGSVEKRIIVR